MKRIKILGIAVMMMLISSLLGVEYSALAEKQFHVKNGGFEEPPNYKTKSVKWIQNVIKKGWDLGEGPEAIMIPGWVYNVNTGPAKVRLIEGTSGKEVNSGEKCLMVQSDKSAQIYNRAKGYAGCEYSFSLYVRGKGQAQVTLYQYDKKNGREIFLNSIRIWRKDVSNEWEKYDGVLKTTHPEAKTFLFALTTKGEVYIDDVILDRTGNVLSD